MIARLIGSVVSVHESSILIISSGIGFQIYTPVSKTFELNKEVQLHISFQWNPDQGPTLFGFLQHYEKLIFELLITCPGIGPRIALGMLAHASADPIINAIINQEDAFLNSIPGIGKKKAEQIILFLKDKVEKLIQQGIVTMGCVSADIQKLSEVLTSLDYSKTEIQSALQYLRQEQITNMSFDNKLRKTLNFLSKRL